ncbi:MAG: hypothetical protein ACXADS_16450, partial [Candidatus Thorarchaeota archaeon]|jgi:hypothetical protein
MKMERGITLVVISVLVVASSAAFLLVGDLFGGLEPVPPPDEPPSEVVDSITADGLELVASAFFWQDFMPSTPPEGPPFYLVIRVNVTNNGNATVFGLDISRVSVYFGNLTLLHTFDIEPGVECCSDEFSVAPGHTEIFQFTNNRETVFSPEVAEDTELFAQILLTWDSDGQAIITTASVPLLYTH